MSVDCKQFSGMKKRLCEGWKIDPDTHDWVKMDAYEHLRYINSFAGLEVPPRRRKKQNQTGKPIKSAQKEGVGTELERLFQIIKLSACGGCKALRDQMNEWTPDECEKRKTYIIRELEKNSKKRFVLGMLFSEKSAEVFVDQAIDNARKRLSGDVVPTGIFQHIVSKVSRKLKTPKKKESPSFVWSYGITTVPERFDNTFKRTLESLRIAGFSKPHVFIDKCSDAEPYQNLKLDCTIHTTNIRTFGNWVTALWELYVLKPHADRYAIFQDDIVCSVGLRKYLESVSFPDKGYLNLLTFPENQELIEKHGTGFYPSNQKGKGAVALVFTRQGVETLLSHSHIIKRPQNEVRGHKAIDGGIVETFRKVGWKEYVHNPSLVQHIGDVSSMGNPRHPKAPSFRGEDFNLTDLVSIKDKQKVSLVGYHCNSGLGELNRQIAEYTDIMQWIIKPHQFKTTNPFLDAVESSIVTEKEKVRELIEKSETVLFCENPYYNNLISDCKRYNKRIVCVPMIEWTPKMGWTKHVDLFICPTRQCYNILESEGLPCVYFPWPIDTDRFQFHPRRTCERFLFVNGYGGWNGRKGSSIIKTVKELWPEMPLTVISQRNEEWPLGTKVISEVQDNQDIYDYGDVLLCPHSVDGLGLEPLEAMACGLPVISTSGEPWNEIPSLDKIQATSKRQKVGREIDWYSCNSESLLDQCKHWVGKDITQQSNQAMQWASSRSWNQHKQEFWRLVTEGKPS